MIETVTYKDGEIVINEGECNYDRMKMYFVEQGKAVAVSTNGGTSSEEKEVGINVLSFTFIVSHPPLYVF